jgi:Fic family protein
VAFSLEAMGMVSDAERAISWLQHLQGEGGKDLAWRLKMEEARASSAIDSVEVSAKELAQGMRTAMIGVSEDVERVVGNIQANNLATVNDRTEITVDQIKTMHAALMGYRVNSYGAGHGLRRQPGWRGGESLQTAIAIAAPEEMIGALLVDLCQFMNRKDLPALVQAAIAHAQFELIRPFETGNGRVGRTLVAAILKQRGLAERMIVPLSMVWTQDREGYSTGLEAYRLGYIVGWCAQVAQATAIAVEKAAYLSGAFERLEAQWLSRAGTPRTDSTVRSVLRMLPAYPVVDARLVETALDVPVQTATSALNALEKAGILSLTQAKEWGREWVANEVFEVLEGSEEIGLEGTGLEESKTLVD